MPYTSVPPDGYWESYTPTWGSTGTQPAIGNGTLSGEFSRNGRIVVASAKVTIGSTTTLGTGIYNLSLPIPASASVERAGGLVALGLDTSAGQNIIALGYEASTTTMGALGYLLNAAAATVIDWLAAGFPVTWANGDYFVFKLLYESAA